MEFIELNTVHYLSTEGITLTVEKPRIPSNEEILTKLKSYLDAGYLKLVKEEVKPVKEIKKEDKKEIKKYTSKELKAMNKGELLDICKELQIKVKANEKVAELEDKILAQYK